jgi:hypothetical protein
MRERRETEKYPKATDGRERERLRKYFYRPEKGESTRETD